ncbi:MAG TPA: hypothetical protein VLZ84_05580, partial [Asticcacaulis sp.]|nr:hypothetical protein [Asticcacaulis sp.]
MVIYHSYIFKLKRRMARRISDGGRSALPKARLSESGQKLTLAKNVGQKSKGLVKRGVIFLILTQKL